VRSPLTLAALPLATLLPVVLPAGAATVPDPSGVWMRGDGNARVRIAPCGEKICATNLWIKDTSRGEAVGDRLIMSIAPEDADTLSGEAYDPKRKMTYTITVTVAKDRLATRGCMLKVLCANVSWTRAD